MSQNAAVRLLFRGVGSCVFALGPHCRDEDVTEHLDFIKGIPSVVGVSHHDLLYAREDEEIPEEPEFHEGTEMR